MAVDGMINFDMCQGQLVPREAFFGIPVISFRFYQKFVIVLFYSRKGRDREKGIWWAVSPPNTGSYKGLLS